MTNLTRADLWSLEQYAEKRPDFRAQVMAHKKTREVCIGSNARLCFEDETTIRYQIQEMLRVERILKPRVFRKSWIATTLCCQRDKILKPPLCLSTMILMSAK